MRIRFRPHLRYMTAPSDPAGAITPGEGGATPPAAPAAPAVPAPGEPLVGDQLGAGGLKALQEERARANTAEASAKALQEKLDEIAAKDMTDLQREQAARATAEAAAATATAEALRWRIAARHGVSDEDAELFLTGADEDTLTRQAERLAARAGGATPPPVGTFVPGAGHTPPAPPSLAQQITAAQAEGDTAQVMALKSQQLAELAKK